MRDFNLFKLLKAFKWSLSLFYFLVLVSAPSSVFAAAMTDYCVVPPYVIQNVPANVMLVLDTSGSMLSFAYTDGFHTASTADDHNCSDTTGQLCTGFDLPGAYPTYKYYGYFDPDYWYEYGSNVFSPTAPKTGSGLSGERAKLGTEWDGNFLNWVTMRRIDIIRKVLTGGKPKGAGADAGKLTGEKSSVCTNWGLYKRIGTAQDYTSLSGSKDFTVNQSGGSCVGGGASSVSDFTVSGGGGTFSVTVVVPTPVEGVIQNVVGTKARLGIITYETDGEGGNVDVSVGGTSMSSVINRINNAKPDGYTPLGEVLWTVAGYFAQIDPFQGYTTADGPMYHNGDYTINNNNDPYNFGTSTARWPACAKSFVLFLTDGEPCLDGNLPSAILNYAQSQGSAYNCGTPNATNICPAAGPFTGSSTITATPCTTDVVAGMEDVALWVHTKDLRNYNTLGGTANSGNISGIQNLTLYNVFAFGKGSRLLRYAAINGGFEDSNANNIPDLQSEWDNNGDNEPDTFYEATDGYELEQSISNALSTMLRRASSGTAASVLASGEGSGANLVQAVFYPRRRFGNDIIQWTGSLQNMWYYVDPFFTSSTIREDTLQESPNRILHLINDYIVQLYFDTTAQETKARRFQDTDGDGDADVTKSTVSFESLGNLWEAGKILWSRDLTTSPRTIKTWIDSNGDGVVDSGEFVDFSTGNAATLLSYLDLPTSGDTNLDGFIDGDINHSGPFDATSVNDTDAQYLIRYVHGEDGDVIDVPTPDGVPEHRTRTVNIGGVTNPWKLGDILNSTPKISSWLPLNTYHKVYKDTTYGALNADPSLSDPADATHFITRDTAPTGIDGVGLGGTPLDGYRRRGIVFAGGNDGMFHAFKLGTLELKWIGQDETLEKARLSGTDIGKELWAFMPKNVLPYLRYTMDPDYCHIYSVDLTPYVFDASINIDFDTNDDNVVNGDDTQPAECTTSEYWRCTKTKDSWRTIVIGGMRFGGACRKTGTACNNDGVSTTDCVNTPKLDPADATKGLGYSAYFALDVTDQNNPRLLWEFSHENLGFATTGPAIVRINARAVSGGVSIPDQDKNGRWFVVFGSGPTGPVSSSDMQFLGRSDQNLKLFIFDLKKGPGTNNADVVIKEPSPAIPFAFAGSMLNSMHDADQTELDYQDDAVYLGYVKKCTSTNAICTVDTWTDGGVLRLLTKEDLSGNNISSTGTTALNPNNWAVSKVMDGIGPVTSSIARLQKTSTGTSWLFFGTGRYYFTQGTTTDDADTRRALFGIKEPCFSSGFDVSCTTQRLFCTTPATSTTCGDLTNVTDIANVPSDPDGTGFKGWYINMDPAVNPTDPDAVPNCNGVGTTNCTGGKYGYCEGSPEAIFCRNYKAERVITDPLATTTGVVFFTSYKPYADECALGGKSFIWAMKYSTGGSAGALLKGKAMVQVSTGSIEQIDLKDEFDPTIHGDAPTKSGRRSGALEGVPPTAQGLSLISSPPAVKKVLHMKER